MNLLWLIALALGVDSAGALSLKFPRRKHNGMRPSMNHFPKIGALITVHPPKFHHLAQFLEDYANCSAARDVMSIYVIFANEDNRSEFEHGLRYYAPNLPNSLWTPIVPSVFPDNLQTSYKSQQIAAWKKWYGIAYMMDMGSFAPDYGLMLDSELRLYNKSDCGPTSSWYQFYDRLKALEDSKTWLAARTDRSKSYKLTKKRNITGQEYDKLVLKENSFFVYENYTGHLSPPNTPVGMLEYQHDNALYSWWTDIPYVSLSVMKRFFRALADKPEGRIQPAIKNETIPRNGGFRRWQDLSSRIRFPRFEHLSYQAYCVLHEGYRIKDVTPLTQTSTWGSYNEDPKPGSKIWKLDPLWISALVYKYAKIGKIEPMSRSKPPLMIFHIDHDAKFFNVTKMMYRWRMALVQHVKESRKISKS